MKDTKCDVKIMPELGNIKTIEELQDLIFESLMGWALVKEED